MIDIIAHILGRLSIPYGYTLAIWSAGALAAWKYKKPQPRDIFFFLFGAILAYILFGLVTFISHTPFQNIVQESRMALMNISAVISALIISLVTREIKNKDLGYFSTGFFATFVYITVLVVELSVII